jgi:hypothetical protein
MSWFEVRQAGDISAFAPMEGAAIIDLHLADGQAGASLQHGPGVPKQLWRASETL